MRQTPTHVPGSQGLAGSCGEAEDGAGAKHGGGDQKRIVMSSATEWPPAGGSPVSPPARRWDRSAGGGACHWGETGKSMVSRSAAMRRSSKMAMLLAAGGPRRTAGHLDPRALAAAQHPGRDEVLEAGHHGPAGHPDRGGESALRGHPRPRTQLPPVDRIQRPTEAAGSGIRPVPALPTMADPGPFVPA